MVDCKTKLISKIHLQLLSCLKGVSADKSSTPNVPGILPKGTWQAAQQQKKVESVKNHLKFIVKDMFLSLFFHTT